jgi:hypothetical protein
MRVNREMAAAELTTLARISERVVDGLDQEPF